ncbi:hypothetical protein D9613_003531 [Agrocybe pediades]|uniref:HAT C-terminal dimerisation domain-containing protein n=1 Tax=Agrocybe pediades TaxID=84607 RepID=A0A8H4QPK5_9AGAR|nr:hypothetical protein D9613_003531 [Agrocybe pediades]
MIHKEWSKNYKPKDKAPPVVTDDGALSRTSSFAKKYFNSLNEDDVLTSDTLEDWLVSPLMNTSLNSIEYWTQMDGGGNRLAHMALDYFSIPASSTDVEQSFSHGGLTISKLRHSLSDESARAACVMGSWTSLDGAIPKDQIIESFREKWHWPKKKACRESTALIIVDD